jgi:hypothetical protein
MQPLVTGQAPAFAGFNPDQIGSAAAVAGWRFAVRVLPRRHRRLRHRRIVWSWLTAFCQHSFIERFFQHVYTLLYASSFYYRYRFRDISLELRQQNK